MISLRQGVGIEVHKHPGEGRGPWAPAMIVILVIASWAAFALSCANFN